MFPVTLAELFLLALAAWAFYRLLAPFRRRVERAILTLLDPSRSDIVDAEVVRESKTKKEPKKE